MQKIEAGEFASEQDSPDVESTALLLPLAKQIRREIRLRYEIDEQINEPRWLILLEIYIAMTDARDTTFTSAAHASGLSFSTAQRYVHEMVAAGLIAQGRSNSDQRITHVRLSPVGLALVGRILAATRVLRTAPPKG